MKVITVDMPDGSLWYVPIDVIESHRSRHYAHEYGGSVSEAYFSDTKPAFDADPDCAVQWATNNMEWYKDIKPSAFMVRPPSNVFDFAAGWTNGKKEVKDI